MKLKDIFQTTEEQTAEFVIPEGVYPDTAGAVVVFRLPTPREALDLAERNLTGLEAEHALIALVLKEIRRGDEVLPAAEIDLEALPVPVWRFIDQCAAGVIAHGRSHAGEALRGWQKRQSKAANSTGRSWIS